MKWSLYRRYDWGIVAAVLVLMAFGILAIYSVDLSRSSGAFLNFQKQIIFACLGIAVLLTAPLFNWRLVQYQSRWIYLAGLATLVGVLFFGTVINGARGWFNFGGISFQPVEFAKIALIIALAKYFSNQGYIPNWGITIKGFTLLAIYLIPVVLQPDMGGASILAAIWLGTLLMMRLPKKIIITLGIGAVTLAMVGWSFVLRDYQKDRILTFLDPTRDPRGRGYNITQSIVAVGAGGMFGRGLGAGSQSQLHFLPEAHTDFIFAVLSEELGFIAGTIIISCYVFIMYRLTRISHGIRDNFSLFFIAGTQILIGAQAFINIGMNIGVLPVTGLPLPLVSYGGSALLATCLLLGIVQSIKVRSAS